MTYMAINMTFLFMLSNIYIYIYNENPHQSRCGNPIRSHFRCLRYYIASHKRWFVSRQKLS